MLTALIIDDEERARNSLAAAIQSFCPEVKILAQASNVPEGVELIKQHQPQLVFLDIEMPEYNGFELLNFIEDINFDIIFVTAYSQYAIRAFEVSAMDYLLKPVEVSALQNAVKKAIDKQSITTITKRLEILKDSFINEEIKKISLPMADGLHFVEVNEIVCLEADGAYTTVCLHNGARILVSKKLKFFEDVLSNRPNFFRPHRSFLINLNFIKKYTRAESTILMDNQSQVSLSRDLKGQFEALLKDYRLSI
ncbi:MAG: LytTR family DNA-binding domain-containing protein [Bacteroidota bacterium]